MSEPCASKAANTHLIEEIDRILPIGMLSSPQIAYCILEFKIIENYDLQCLGPATYNMRLGGRVLSWNNGQKEDYLLDETEDKNKNIRRILTLRPNSLTFVTTIEKFQLPKDIIARFNLKSKFIHKGLLLGTGPIVDPELHANLLIPLHNFSSNDIDIEFGEEIISVEFTKTLNPDAVFDKEGCEYVCNKHWDYNFEKYRDRIGKGIIESSVESTLNKYGKTLKDYEVSLDSIKNEYQASMDEFKIDVNKTLIDATNENKKSLKVFNWIGGLTAFGTLIGLIVLVFTTYQLIKGSFDQLTEATNIVKECKEQNLDYRSLAKISDQKEIASKVEYIENSLFKLQSSEFFLKNQIENNKKLNGSYEKDVDSLKERMADIQKRINELTSIKNK